MSKRFTPAYGGNPRVHCVPSGMKATWADCTTANIPTDGTAGYEASCYLQVYDGAAGAQFYINTGTKTSCAFRAVPAGLATAAEIDRVADVSTRIVALATSTSITEALHEGKILKLTGTGSAFTQTLPAANGSGAKYTFMVGAVNTSNHVIALADGGDVFTGNVWTNSTGDTPDLGQPWASASNTTITLNGTTTGGAAVGDTLEFVDIAADIWRVLGHTTTSGVEATPFSGS